MKLSFLNSVLFLSFASIVACSPTRVEVIKVPPAHDDFQVHEVPRENPDGTAGPITPEEAPPRRRSETSRDRKHNFLFGNPNFKWRRGIINWWYNPAGQPANMTHEQALQTILNAANNWNRVCGVTFVYQGLTRESLSRNCDGKTVVTWTPYPGRQIGNAKVCYDRERGGFSEFDIGLDNSQPYRLNTRNLEEVAGHEFGHALGLSHTTIDYALMTAVVTSPELVEDDIEGCQAIYGDAIEGGGGGNVPPTVPDDPPSLPPTRVPDRWDPPSTPEPPRTPIPPEDPVVDEPEPSPTPRRSTRRKPVRMPNSCVADSDCGESFPGCRIQCDTTRHCSAEGTECGIR